MLPHAFFCFASGVESSATYSDLAEDDLAAFCARQMTAYKRPRFIEFRDELPKSNVGKILRRELRPPTA